MAIQWMTLYSHHKMITVIIIVLLGNLYIQTQDQVTKDFTKLKDDVYQELMMVCASYST